MNADVKTQWIAALRSGQFMQGTGALARETAEGTVTHCCLGVLCEVLGIEKSAPAWRGEISFDACALTLPLTAIQASGLMHESPSIKVTPEIKQILVKHQAYPLDCGTPVMLSELNDFYHCSFACIADIIEEAF